MHTIHSVNEMQSQAIAMRTGNRLIGFVPTMGCLHEGHLSLIDAARQKADKVIVSIFVNPAQFGPNEDFEAYPRQLATDLELCRERGADLVFNPSAEAMFPEGFSTYVHEEHVSAGLEGVSRPRFFRGVTTVCLKLFNIVRPDLAVFGEKDAQQAAVIQKMVEDLNLPLSIETGPTVREPDGLAMSSRNRYLADAPREEAVRLYRALQAGKELVDRGTRSVDRVVAEITHQLARHRRIRVIYIQVVDRATMRPAREIQPGRDIACLAAWVDDVRLIDNIAL